MSHKFLDMQRTSGILHTQRCSDRSEVRNLPGVAQREPPLSVVKLCSDPCKVWGSQKVQVIWLYFHLLMGLTVICSLWVFSIFQYHTSCLDLQAQLGSANHASRPSLLRLWRLSSHLWGYYRPSKESENRLLPAVMDTHGARLTRGRGTCLHTWPFCH